MSSSASFPKGITSCTATSKLPLELCSLHSCSYLFFFLSYFICSRVPCESRTGCDVRAARARDPAAGRLPHLHLPRPVNPLHADQHRHQVYSQKVHLASLGKCTAANCNCMAFHLCVFCIMIFCCFIPSFTEVQQFFTSSIFHFTTSQC